MSTPLRPLRRGERPAKIWERFHVGMRVTVRDRQQAYYSGYAGHPVCFLEPGMEGVLAVVDVPYVRYRKGNSASFACVDFDGPLHGNPGRTEWRAGVDPKNLVPVGTSGARFIRPPNTVRVTRAPDWRCLVGYTAEDKAVLSVVADAGTGIFGDGTIETVRRTLADAGYVLELIDPPSSLVC
jgi:hypothetical protein